MRLKAYSKYVSKCLIILALLTIESYSIAQVNYEKGKYFEVPELKEIEGIWVGSSNSSDSLILELKSTKEFLKGPDVYADQLSGKYFYYKNKVLVEKSSEKSLSAGSISQKKPSVIILFQFNDNRKQKSGDIILEMTTFKSKSAKWILRNKEGVIVVKADGKTVDDKIRDQSFSVPSEIILTKIR